MTRRWFSVLSVIAAGACATSPTESLLGPWRSEALNMRVAPESTEVWGGCGYGTIPGPLVVSDQGRFEADFDFGGGGGAPPRPGEVRSVRLHLIGTVSGDRLVVSLDAMGSAPPDVYHLERGEGQPFLPCPAAASP